MKASGIKENKMQFCFAFDEAVKNSVFGDARSIKAVFLISVSKRKNLRYSKKKRLIVFQLEEPGRGTL